MRIPILVVLCCCLLAPFLQAQDKSTEPIAVLLKKLSATKGVAQAKLLLTIADSYILKQGEDKLDMDSAKRFIDQAVDLNRTLNNAEVTGTAYIIWSKWYRERGEQAQGKGFAQKALDWAGQHELPVQLAYGHAEMAAYFNWEKPSDLDVKIDHVRKAAELFRKTGRLEMQARTLEHLGDCLLIRGVDEEALTVLHRAVDLYKAAGVDDLHGVYDLLGGFYASSGDYPEGLRYGLLAVKSMEVQKDTSGHWLAIYNTVGLIYNRLRDWQASKDYFEKAAAVAERFKDSSALRILWNNIGNCYHSMGKEADALRMLRKVGQIFTPKDDDPFSIGYFHSLFGVYLELKMMDSIRVYYHKSSRIHDRLPYDNPRNTYYYYVAIRYHLANKQFDRMLMAADSMRAFAQKSKLAKEIERSYYFLFQADSALGNFPAAIKHYQQHIAFKDSIQSEASQKQVNRLKIEFETDKKDSDIKSLQLQQEEKDSQLQAASLRFKVIIAGIVMLLILLVLVYSRYQLKIKSNRQLLEQKELIDSKNERLEVMNKEQEKLLEEKEWLMKEIHHRVKNNLQVVISLLNTQSVYLDNERAKEAIMQSQHRMHAMSLIHQRLYQSDSLAVIDMRTYIHELIGYLRDSLDMAGKVRFLYEVDDIRLDTVQAVPIGLILNEAITNSIKYAFPDNARGSLMVFLSRQPEGLLLLKVEDDGVGLPEGFDVLKAQSMGMNLINILARQLGGQLTYMNRSGFCLQISFAADEAGAATNELERMVV
ncbi:histidine kinase dimerization/phosphoacceptor domain -containing protein [Paraflavitalea sp. CAU 1676]|uniref:tetratricopeptide repeat-containing sensor histidine kinase n=1 Tax=Paraflavitalea sp. CAU 1676 TaxID=3032598 RepID=UPI0023DB8D7D|nr:histidine kinase dimerization/phosphoacceptor domain -containing protein [Paraflavitalea sp. CAU 1676]MDF2187983.1 histidine kinase dimerization/phosphoacceptor domain -containing protein [Paraflavitalea sp. CAU 1676]